MGKIEEKVMELERFQAFFDSCVGNWQTERTYHYLTRQEVERSHTEFGIEALTASQKLQVLRDNEYPVPKDLAPLPGYHLEFQTVSETGEKVSQQLNLMFVPTQQTGTYLEGDYLRDRAYEEDRPIISHFRFDNLTRELLMTTNYTRVIAVDSITMIHPELRIRKILSYRRPENEEPLKDVVLVGFGVEQKQPQTAL